MSTLRAERKKRGMSQFQLGKLSDISPTDISKIERGVTVAFPGWKRRLAKALGVSETSIFPEVTGNDRKSNAII